MSQRLNCHSLASSLRLGYHPTSWRAYQALPSEIYQRISAELQYSSAELKVFETEVTHSVELSFLLTLQNDWEFKHNKPFVLLVYLSCEINDIFSNVVNWLPSRFPFSLEYRRELAGTLRIARTELDPNLLVICPDFIFNDVAKSINILAGDDNTSMLPLYAGVPGVTSISVLRRLSDSRFATRYFRGNGLDIGGGGDSIALFKELFPLITSVFLFDTQHGDGQYLENIPDSQFDFIYSSHCLEHLHDPKVSLKNWIRVLKPGGYIVCQIPDEDLYEQGFWPSQFNNDHKHTFTLYKAQSWSPVSINVLSLLSGFGDQVKVHSVQLHDEAYRYSIAHHKVDQTRMPMAECAVEFVIQKINSI